MSDLMSYINIAPSNTFIFTNACNNDLCIYTESKTQCIHLGTQSNYQSMLKLNSNTIFIGGHILPISNIAFDLGSCNFRFRDLYLSGNTLDINGTQLKCDPSGSIAVQDSNGVPKTLIVSEIQLGSLSNALTLKFDSNTNALQVQATTTSNGVQTTTSNPVIAGGSGSGSGGGVLMGWSNSACNNVYILTSNVGIHTSNPKYPLDVNGAVNITGVTYVSSNIMPTSNEMYDLGSSNMRFRTLYIASNTIDMGAVAITYDSTAGGIKITDSNNSNAPIIANQIQLGSLSNLVCLSLDQQNNIMFTNYTLSNGVQVQKDGSININVMTKRFRPSPAEQIAATSRWVSRSTPANNGWYKVIWAAEIDIFVAIAYSGTNRVMTSYDGLTWTLRTPPAENTWYGICWAPQIPMFVVVGISGVGNRIMTSPDGITWQSRTSPIDNNWTSVCWSSEKNLFVAVAASGTGNRVMTSFNGINWVARTTPADNQWTSVVWVSELSLFVAVANSGTYRVMTSYDGINWALRYAPPYNWTCVCYSDELNLLVAVASSGTGYRVMTSPNGIYWTLRSTPADNDWQYVCWSPELSLFIAVANTGTNNRIMVSTNGIQWTLRYVPVNNNWLGICWAPELSMFVGVSDSGVGNRVLTSLPAIPASKSTVMANPSQFTVSSNGYVGINNMYPNFPLDVNGDINVVGNIRQNGVIFSGGGGTSQWTTSSNNVYLINSNVGIGLSNPQAQLHVTSNMRVDGIMSFGGLEFQRGSLIQSTGDGYIGSNIWIHTSNLGIGKSNPIFPLDVIGDVNITGNFRQNGIVRTGFSTSGSNFYVMSNLSVGKSNAAYALDVVGDINITGNFKQNGVTFSGGGGGGTSQWTSSSNNVYLLASNVGIGLSNPQAQLHVSSNMRVDGVMSFGGLEFKKGSLIQSVGGGGGGGGSGSIAGYSNTPSGTILSVPTLDENFYFKSSNTSLMTITGLGSVGIGKSNPSYALDVVGQIHASSDIFANSDIRMKTNLNPIQNALEKVKQIHGYTFNFLNEEEKKVGVIAQEVELVLPEVISQDVNGFKSVAYGNMSALLIESIKELANIVKTQQEKIQELESVIHGLL